MSFLWEGEDGQAPSLNLLEALAETEPGVTPSCCPRAPHQAELVGSVGPSLPALCQRFSFGHRAVLPGSGRTRPPALPARPQPAFTPAHCWAAPEGTGGEAATEMKTQKYEELVKKTPPNPTTPTGSDKLAARNKELPSGRNPQGSTTNRIRS